MPIDSVESLTMQNNPTIMWCEIVQRVILESGCGKSHPDYRMLEEVKQESQIYVEADRRWEDCLLYTSPSPRDVEESRMPSSA